MHTLHPNPLININNFRERFQTFRNVMNATSKIDKTTILKEFAKSISFRKIIDDVGFPIIGFLLQQLERGPNKDFRLYINTLHKIGFNKISKSMFTIKDYKLDIKNLKNALHNIKTDANAELIKTIMEIHDKYKIVNINKNIKEWIMNEENIINTLGYFFVVISIKLICTVLITSIPQISIFNVMKPIIKKHASQSENSVNIDLYDMQNTSDNNPTLNHLEPTNDIDEEKYKELTARISEIIWNFNEKKYITFLRKLPALLLMFFELNKITQELEPGINLNNDFLESIELSDEEQIKKYFTQLMTDAKSSPDSISKIILDSITPFLDLYNQHAEEISDVDISYHGINQPIKLPIKHIDFKEPKKLLIKKLLIMINLYNSIFANNYISYKMPHTDTIRKKGKKTPNGNNQALNISNLNISESKKPTFSNNTLESLIHK